MMEFVSPTKGVMTFEEMFKDIINYVNEQPKEQYKLITGSDSQMKESAIFVTAIIIHRVGKGARYYFHKQKHRYMESLRQRIYYETFLSLEAASRLSGKLSENGYANMNVEIHLDVGENGDTKDIIREVVGMVIGSGFDARIKPDSYGASTVADKYTK
ncbi:ribonuclease H-like YkuK family protein [Candidatus Contubernalis alkalaceticus]|uniref:ribonuclease H-like YkuK family protein n=1 Tax=Candidatus Contubernalis alkaliaceticus TaxID=338645 RepID=UPI0029625BC3|nr:ribonuclease H-like YkuK family protein [Candidatus Contubernalis alkalaceticus]